MGSKATDIQAAVTMSARMIPVWTKWCEISYDHTKDAEDRESEHSESCHGNGCPDDDCDCNAECTCGGDDAHHREIKEEEATWKYEKDGLLEAQIALDDALSAAYRACRAAIQGRGFRILNENDRSFASKYLTFEASADSEAYTIRFSDHAPPAGRGGRYQHPETGEVCENAEANFSVHPESEFLDGGSLEGALELIERL